MWDFGHADSIEPEAIGEPGERRFRIRVMARLESASLWLEKEQVAALALALRRLLEQTKPAEEPIEPEPVMGGSFPEMPDVEFRPSRLGIGHDDEATNISIFAYDPETAEEEDPKPAFSCQVSRGQARAFARRAEEIINAGRPVCVLCGLPIDETTGHKCLRRNGHAGPSASLG